MSHRSRRAGRACLRDMDDTFVIVVDLIDLLQGCPGRGASFAVVSDSDRTQQGTKGHMPMTTVGNQGSTLCPVFADGLWRKYRQFPPDGSVLMDGARISATFHDESPLAWRVQSSRSVRSVQ